MKHGHLNNDPKAKILAISAVILWSTVATAFKIGLKHLEPDFFLFYVILSSVIFLLLYLSVTRQWIGFKGMSTKEWQTSIFGGLIMPFAYYMILFEAYDRLPAQIAQSLNYTWAIVLVVFSALLHKQKIKSNVSVGLSIGFIGVVTVVTRGELRLNWFDGLGVVLALSSSVIWAGYWILSKSSTLDPVKFLFINQTTGLLATFLWLLLTGRDFTLPVSSSLTAAIYCGIFEMGATFVLWISAIKFASKAEKISHFIFLSPLLSLFFIRFLLGEPIYFSTFLGLILIILGILTIELGSAILNHLRKTFTK